MSAAPWLGCATWLRPAIGDQCRVVGRKRMLTTAKLFQLLNEGIVLLLGALLIVLAISGRVGLPTRLAGLIALGVIFVYWGARAWVRREPTPVGSSSKVRA